MYKMQQVGMLGGVTRKIYEAAVRGLCPVEASLTVNFPLPDSEYPFSLMPGSLAPFFFFFFFGEHLM
ncbi:hypothetical protein RGQ29_023324 [Quercus rubra]|uniref:Uncharacterized protein n=1 Tax=Quercus rubra TaxID=3512 RepID=A0AAN7F9B3_QUERU|nr:hypothetical protein RGQ29_023324 [Quercus rubra]